MNYFWNPSWWKNGSMTSFEISQRIMRLLFSVYESLEIEIKLWNHKVFIFTLCENIKLFNILNDSLSLTPSITLNSTSINYSCLPKIHNGSNICTKKWPIRFSTRLTNISYNGARRAFRKALCTNFSEVFFRSPHVLCSLSSGKDYSLPLHHYRVTSVQPTCI